MGVTESGYYTIRRCTYDYELWYKNAEKFKLLGRSTSLSGAKNDAEQHRSKHEA
jgi:hypothetical protein